MLENRYYKILDINHSDDGSYVCSVHLCEDCDVYRGHFPGNPIAPGVCNIQLIRECVEKILSKKLKIDNIKQIRFLTLVEPTENNLYIVSLHIDFSDKIDVVADIKSDKSECLTLKMSLVEF